jgi:hypothetical protein
MSRTVPPTKSMKTTTTTDGGEMENDELFFFRRKIAGARLFGAHGRSRVDDGGGFYTTLFEQCLESDLVYCEELKQYTIPLLPLYENDGLPLAFGNMIFDEL